MTPSTLGPMPMTFWLGSVPVSSMRARFENGLSDAPI